MPTFPLIITSKWQSRNPILFIPGFGQLKRPTIGKMLIMRNEKAATWLIEHGFAQLTSIAIPHGMFYQPREEASDSSSSPPERQLILNSNSELELEPPLVTEVPGNEEKLLLDFFQSSEASEINSTIRAITLKMAQELKQADPLDWTAVVRTLSDRALDAAAKWAAQQQQQQPA